VENLVAKIWGRQSVRLMKAREDRIEAPASENQVPPTEHTVADNENVEAIEDDDTSKPVSKENNSLTESGAEFQETDESDGEQCGSPSDSDSASKSENERSNRSEATEDTEITNLDKAKTTNLDDFYFTKEDILGPDPSGAILEGSAWKYLQSLTGITAVKRDIRSMLELLKSNFQRELSEQPLHTVSLNRLFLGPPGTGKTLVAKLYGQLLAEAGVLSKGEVIVRNPSDLIGRYIGDSEQNMRSALSAAMGSVLVIDEAHMLYQSSSDGVGSDSDSYR